MNKKQGFTLIELLAVIVVLAILALILIPIVTTTIKNAKKGAAEKENSTTTALCTVNKTKVSALVWAGNDDPGQESSYTRQEVGLLASESGAYTPGVTYTCELGDGESNTFYVLEENGDNVSLIAGFNLGDTVAWSEDGSNHKDEDVSKQAVTAKTALKERTSGWTKLTESQISLPTGQQIATAGGDSAWTDSNYTGTTLSTWLYSYAKTPVAYGYWTSTPLASYSSDAWFVGCDGSLFSVFVGDVGDSGVRPVITVAKSQLN